MIKIKDNYKGKFVKCPVRKVRISVDEIPESKYEYYFNNGLDYIFEKSKKVKYKGIKDDKNSTGRD